MIAHGARNGRLSTHKLVLTKKCIKYFANMQFYSVKYVKGIPLIASEATTSSSLKGPGIVLACPKIGYLVSN
jgi:hypothetical protein